MKERRGIKLADEKRKRGRPPKIPQNNIENEEVKQITMSSKENKERQKEIKGDEQINILNNYDSITLQQVQQRWSNLFSKFADLGYESIVNAYNQGWSNLNNPFLQNFRIKQILARPDKMTQEDLQEALIHPENSELELNRVSMYLYYTNYMYHFLINLNRETPTFKWFVTPQYLNYEDMDKDNFKKESQMVDKIMKTFKPNLTFKTITNQVSFEGKSSYLPRISYDKNTKEVNFFVLQKLNTNMVKLTGFGSKQQFIASFNMMIFLQPAYDVSQYPRYIQKVWEDMNGLGIINRDKNNNLQFNPTADIPKNHVVEWTGKYYMYWVELPQELCYTFYSDGSHPMAFPDTIGLFNDLNDLADYRWLQASLLSKGVTSIMTAQVPMIKDPKAGSDATSISPDTVLGYTDLFNQTVSGNILPFFAPFTNYELHTLESQPQALDVIYDRTRDLIATSGQAALLPITDKPSIASVKAAQNIQASKVDYLTRQFEQFLDNIINSEFELKNKWKVSIWGDIFNIRDDAKNLKELVLSGLEGFIPKLLSAYDLSLEDYRSSILYMKALDVKIEKSFELEKMKLQSDLNEKMYQDKESIEGTKIDIKEETKNTDTGTGNQVGRPKLSEDEIENDNTASSVDAGTNVSDIKEFNFKLKYNSNYNYNFDFHKCIKCGKELDYDEQYICDECLEEEIENKFLNE